MIKKNVLDRRTLIKTLGLSAGAALVPPMIHAASNVKKKKSKKVLTVAHITDIHIRPEHDAPNRFRKCLEDIKKHKVDFSLNGGILFMQQIMDTLKENASKNNGLYGKSSEMNFLNMKSIVV
jgi:hypothetical protein